MRLHWPNRRHCPTTYDQQILLDLKTQWYGLKGCALTMMGTQRPAYAEVCGSFKVSTPGLWPKLWGLSGHGAALASSFHGSPPPPSPRPFLTTAQGRFAGQGAVTKSPW